MSSFALIIMRTVQACTDLQTASISSIKGGRLRNNVPLTLKNNSDVRHTFSRAHIGNTAVYFVGTLTILEDDGTEQEYIYYTTDKNVTNKTAYAVLKNGDKITLEYTHGKDHTVEYQFKDSDGKVTSEGCRTAGAWIRSLEPTARWKWLTAIVTAIR